MTNLAHEFVRLQCLDEIFALHMPDIHIRFFILFIHVLGETRRPTTSDAVEFGVGSTQEIPREGVQRRFDALGPGLRPLPPKTWALLNTFSTSTALSSTALASDPSEARTSEKVCLLVFVPTRCC
jgi:hypothetical protein